MGHRADWESFDGFLYVRFGKRVIAYYVRFVWLQSGWSGY